MTVPDIRIPARHQGETPPPQVLSRARELRLDRLLVPLDGSDESEQSLAYAALVARRLGGEINLFHCLQPMHPVRVRRTSYIPYPDAQHDRGSHLATAYLQEVKARLKPHGLNARWNVATGSAAHLIAYRAATGRFGLTMLSAHTRPKVVSGIQKNVTTDLWGLTAGPLFLINRKHIQLNGESPSYPETIFVPRNEPEAFEAAMPVATTLATALGARLVILISNHHKESSGDTRAIEIAATERAATEAMAEELRGRGCVTEIEDIAGGVIGIARRQIQERGSWVVAGSQMKTGIRRLLSGNKGDNILRQCRGPLIVTPTASIAKHREKQIRKKVASAETSVSVA